MRATLNIPDELVDKVKKISGQKSKTKAIIVAMEEFIGNRKVKDLLNLRGKVTIDYDWEKEERNEVDAQKKREELNRKNG